MTPERIHEAFPASSYRGNQRDALDRIRDAFAAGDEVVLVRAPTGSGKSLLARAVMGCARRVEDAEPKQATGAYYTTPQVSQLEDVSADPLLDDLQIIRGKNNYTCILRGEEDTPVDRAPCVRERGFDCSVKHRCPYFSDRAVASSRRFAATTLAYFMNTAGSDVFGQRDVVVVDEAHGLSAWAEMYATVELGPRTAPVWDDLEVPDVAGVERAARFAENVMGRCERAREDLSAQEELTAAEAVRRDRLGDLLSDLSWFVEDYRNPEGATWVVDQGDDGALTMTPVDPGRYLHHTVWDRGRHFALLSATILDKDAFCRQVGLDPSRVALVDVGHTFPLENRPLYDVSAGKMTYEEREETLPDVADALVAVMAAHPAETGIVHAHSYAIQSQLADELDARGVGARVRTHDSDDRDAQLAAWLDADDPEVFLSVKMEEALDLADERARWQLLCKAPFPNTRDSRVARRLEDGEWGWYYRAALRTVIQACGRVVRSSDDYGATYVADRSVLDLFERARADMPSWFAAQVDRMADPDLPPADPERALAATSGDPRPPAAERSSAERTGDDAAARERSPLADVWDVE